MNDEQQDSFELFADTLTITLACIIFIALLLVTITRSHQIDESGLFYLERRSDLISKQVEIAAKQVITTEQTLDRALDSSNEAIATLNDYEGHATARLHHFLGNNDTIYANALLAENIRISLFVTKLPWLNQTIQENSNSLEQRIDRAFTEASKHPIALSVLREQNKTATKPIYWIVSHDKLYPVQGGPGKQYRHIKWERSSHSENEAAEQIWQLSPKSAGGLNVGDGLELIRESSAEITRESNYQIVLLVYSDSFEQARTILTELSTMDVNFSWRPLTLNQRILMSEAGLPPDAPF